MRPGSAECDVYKADTVFMAQFVAQDWLLDMTAYVSEREAESIASTLSTAEVGGRYFGIPYDTDASLLFYRDDKVSSAPRTWQELYAQATSNGGLVYQGAAYEGLTCDFLELAFAAGGKVLSDDGKKSQIDSRRAR
jgi:multiple sugar transport system substrate-binding protein